MHGFGIAATTVEVAAAAAVCAKNALRADRQGRGGDEVHSSSPRVWTTERGSRPPSFLLWHVAVKNNFRTASSLPQLSARLRLTACNSLLKAATVRTVHFLTPPVASGPSPSTRTRAIIDIRPFKRCPKLCTVAWTSKGGATIPMQLAPCHTRGTLGAHSARRGTDDTSPSHRGGRESVCRAPCRTSRH
jgi:hypothetical protein